MRRSRSVPAFLALGFVLAGAATPGSAQAPDPEATLEAARTLYREGRFDEAIAQLGRAIEQLQQLRDLQAAMPRLADAHLLVALAYLALRDEASAREHFQHVLRWDPGRSLDPEIYAPKVVALFEKVKGETTPPRAEEPAATPNRAPDRPPVKEGVQLAGGTAVRLRMSGEQRPIEGSLVSINDQTLAFVTQQQKTLELPRTLVAKLEVSGGRKRHAWQGALIGAALGAVIGAVSRPLCDEFGCDTKGESIAYEALGFGGLGALAGAFYRTHQWLEIPLDRITVEVSPRSARAGGGAGLFLSVSF